MEIYIERIKIIRKEKKITQKEISITLKMKQQQYSRYEKCNNQLPIDTFIKIADYLNTDTNYLLGFTDNPKPLH